MQSPTAPLWRVPCGNSALFLGCPKTGNQRTDMPQRFLRPGITNSPRWNRVSWAAQSFYIRLLTLVDDYGRFDGRPSVLWGQCFAVWNEHNPESAVNLQQVAQMLQQLAADSVQLLDLYQVGDKHVLQVTQWQERVRDGAKERWPANPNPQQSAAIRSVSLPPSSPSPPSSPPAPAIIHAHGNDSELSTVEQVLQELSLQMIPPDFIRFVYEDWFSREGKDGAGQQVKIGNYVRKRWTREGAEWRNGKHKGKTFTSKEDEALEMRRACGGI